MITVNGLSNKFCIENECSYKEISSLMKSWFEEIDHLYYSHEDNIQINLNDFDKMIINSFPDCKDKLKTLLFKKNIKIISSHTLLL